MNTGAEATLLVVGRQPFAEAAAIAQALQCIRAFTDLDWSEHGAAVVAGVRRRPDPVLAGANLPVGVVAGTLYVDGVILVIGVFDDMSAAFIKCTVRRKLE